jgi:hypothetical protein
MVKLYLTRGTGVLGSGLKTEPSVLTCIITTHFNMYCYHRTREHIIKGFTTKETHNFKNNKWWDLADWSERCASILKITGSNPSGDSELIFLSDLLLTVRGSSAWVLIEFACLLCYPGNTLCSQLLESFGRYTNPLFFLFFFKGHTLQMGQIIKGTCLKKGTCYKRYNIYCLMPRLLALY